MCASHEVPLRRSQWAYLCPRRPCGDLGHRGPVVDVCPARRGKSPSRGGVARFEIVSANADLDRGPRKKKCDENRPRCNDCRRLNLPCQWSNASISETIDTPSSSSPDSHATASPPSDPIHVSDGDPLAPSSITPQDDEEFIATLFPHPLPKQNAVILPLERSPISTNPYLRGEEDRSLFNHYIHVVARALSRSHDPDRNPFLVTLLPLAAASDAVTSVILSLSGCHWRRVYPSIWGCALKRQGQGW